MPDIDGMMVLQRLRENYSCSELPIIMVTAKDSSEDIVQALQAGANDYVTKPIDLPVVMARLTTQLSLRFAQLQLRQQMEEVQRLAKDLEKRNHFIRNVFGRYLTDDVVSNILDTPDGLALGGQKRTVTILMSDLRGFSMLSEVLPAEQVIFLLNHYLGVMADIISTYQGTIDEFIGDAILVIFGAPQQAPDDAERAVACGLAMQCAMVEVNEQFAQLDLPPLEMGIGINTGEVVVGNIGSQQRAKYGIVGSHVNLTGRLESYSVGGQVLISEGTAIAIGNILSINRSFPMKAKGFEHPIMVHEVGGLTGKYNLFLPDEKDDLKTLVTLVVVEVTLMDGKHGGDDMFIAEALALGQRHVELRSNYPLAEGNNLRLTWSASTGKSIRTYAKVISAQSDNNLVLCRFTGISPEAQKFFNLLR